MSELKCYNCKHRRTIPGSAHSRCSFLDSEKSVAGPVSLLISIAGMIPEGIELDPYGQRMGWAQWPVNFDPVWVKRCDYHQPTATK